MKKALIILNHAPVQGVYEDLKKMGVSQVDLLPDVDKELAAQFAAVPFSVEEVRKLARELANTISGDCEDGYSIVVIAGEARVIHNTIKMAEWSAFQTRFYAPYSQRISVDTVQPDGTVKKVTKFKYEGLAEY